MRLNYLCGLALSIPLLAGTAALPAQEGEKASPTRIAVGGDQVDGSFIKAYTNRWQMFNVGADGKRTPAGSWDDELTLVEHQGKTALVRKQQMRDVSGKVINTSEHMAYHKTLAPISARFSSPSVKGLVTFEGNRVKTSISRGAGDPVENESTLEMAGFDWSIFGTLLLGFPLEVGFHGTFPAVTMDPFTNATSITWQEYTVTKEETLTLANGSQIPTRVVEVAPNIQFFLSLDSPYIIQLIMPTGSGSYRIWEMDPP